MERLIAWRSDPLLEGMGRGVSLGRGMRRGQLGVPLFLSSFPLPEKELDGEDG